MKDLIVSKLEEKAKNVDFKDIILSYTPIFVDQIYKGTIILFQNAADPSAA